MNAPLARNFLIASLALAACTSAESDVTGVDVDTVTGTISVGVTSPGSGDFAITVVLTGPVGFERRTTGTRLGGTATFTRLEPGSYTVSTTIFGFDCQSVTADVQASRTTTASIACNQRTTTSTNTGIVTGVVTSGDSPISGASVELRAPGVSYTRTSGANGNLSFVGVQAGEYTLSASHQHFTCPVQTIHVDPAQTAIANISCTPKPTGDITGIVFSNETTIVHLTGPASRTATAEGSPNGVHFTFDDLPPGTYRITATASGMACSEVSAAVQAGRTTAVEIRCSDIPPVEIGDELLGSWGYIRLNPGQTGICPSPLPDSGSGSIVRGSTNSTIRIIGLDPAIEIVGRYDGGSGGFTGSGTTVRGDGSTLQSDVTGSFYWDVWYDGGFWFSTHNTWTRRHRDPSGNLVCTEVYEAHGYRVF